MVTLFEQPYLLSYDKLTVEAVIIYAMAVLTAILANAEGQGFMATFLGDRENTKSERMHFNVFMHLSFLGTISFFIAGFGWPKHLQINAQSFGDKKKLFLFLSRAAGPFSNILLANIAASIVFILGRWGVEDQVFTSIVLVNVQMAIYSLLLVPPLAGFAMVAAWIVPDRQPAVGRIGLERLGSLLLICYFLAARLFDWELPASFLSPLVMAVASYMVSY